MAEELAAARGRTVVLEAQVAALSTERAALEVQLSEMVKLCELQQADLERYRKAYEASRPNHPERAPRDQLQLAFARVLEALGAEAPANDGDDAEMDDGDGVEDGAGAEAAEGGGEGKRPRKRKKKRHQHSRRRLDTTQLPVIEDRIVPDEVKATGGAGFRVIGEETSERIARRPAEWVRYRMVRVKYVAIETITAEDGSGSSGDGSDASSSMLSASPDGGSRILIAPLPPNVWPNTMGDASAIAQVILSKYDHLLPLNRQQGIAARGGFMLPKSTQCSWLKAAHAFCAPVVDAMFDDAKRNAFLIATDATGARVRPPWQDAGERHGPEPPPECQVLHERRACERWHVFVFLADRDHVVFRYNREHNGAVFAEMLAGYHGNLLADAASVFDVLYDEHDMTENGCWFHCRRPFYRALESDPVRALEALALIGKLFRIDRKLREEQLDLATFTRLRRERAAPVLELIDKWIELQRDRIEPRTPLAAGIGYYQNQRDALRRFLDDGRIRLDNNLSEQALRNLVVGLANWTFFANETGLAWYTTFRSLIASCALHRLNPAIYLEQLLRLVPHWPKHRVLQLAPKFWTATVDKLDTTWRAILARPWEPGVVVPAQLAAPSGERGTNNGISSTSSGRAA